MNHLGWNRAAPDPKAPQLSPDARGVIFMPEDGFSQAVAHHASSDQWNIMAAVHRPISVNCDGLPPPTSGRCRR